MTVPLLWGAEAFTEEKVPITISDVCASMGMGQFEDAQGREWTFRMNGGVLHGINLERALAAPHMFMVQINEQPLVLSDRTVGDGRFFPSYVWEGEEDEEYGWVGIKYFIPPIFLHKGTDLMNAEFYLTRRVPLEILGSYASVPCIRGIEESYRFAHPSPFVLSKVIEAMKDKLITKINLAIIKGVTILALALISLELDAYLQKHYYSNN